MVEVRGLRIVAEESQVVGKWEALPAGAKAVVSRTMVGTSSAAAESVVSGASGFIDAAVSVGAEYEYKVALVFVEGGRVDQTMGVVARVKLHVPEITGVEGKNLGASIELIWTWPEGCDRALVSWRQDRFPASPEERAACRRLVTRGAYGLSRGFHLADPESKRYYFTVFACAAIEDSVQYAGGSSAGARVMVPCTKQAPVHYTVKKILLSRRYELRVWSGSEGAALPELRLVLNGRGVQPVGPDDGQLVLHVLNKTSTYTVEFSLMAKGYLRLFLAQSSLSEQYQMIDPEPAQLDRTR